MVLRYATQLNHEIERFRDGAWESSPDSLAIEEPLELRLAWRTAGRAHREPISITMRTPGRDFELAAGFLYAESIISGASDIDDIGYCRDVESEEERCNTVLVRLRRGLEPALDRQRRNFTTTSACGVCGKASLEALANDGCHILPLGTNVRPDTLVRLPATLRAAQRGFAATGGVHAAGLFDPSGSLVALQEDVGRHNALDKLVGEQLLAGKLDLLAGMVVVLSGRASYELMQKALRARIPIVAAVGAPSSLAVDIARAYNLTLAGFLKPGSFNVYAGRERIHD
jgi:FdhD protein